MKLKFKFVDRAEERKDLLSFFSNKHISEQGIWISGPHNVGKTALVNEVKSITPEKSYIHIVVEGMQYTYFEYLISQISNIDIFGEESFFSFISNKNTKLDSILTKKWGNYFESNLADRLEISHFLLYELKQNNIDENICNDITEFCITSKINGVIFDDFELCDYISLTYIKQFISSLILSNEFSICFITNSDTKLNIFISDFLLENLDIKDMRISAFDDVFFYDEFISSCQGIPTDTFSKAQIDKLFNLSHGYIGNFKQDINELRIQGAFENDSIISTDCIDNYIKEKEMQIYPFLKNGYIKDILIIMILFQYPIHINLLIDIIIKIYNSNSQINCILKNKLTNLIDNLISDDILTINLDQTLSFKKYSFNREFYDFLISNSKVQFINIAGHLSILCDSKWFELYKISSIKISSMHFYCKLILNDESSANEGLKLIQDLFNNKSYLKISEIAERIYPYLNKLNDNDLIKISNYLYFIGSYKLAYNYLNKVNSKKINTIDKIDFLILRGKIKFILLISSSINDFEDAKELCKKSNNRPKYIEIINLLFMAYSENRETLEKAYDEYIEGINIDIECIQYAKLCRNSLNVFSYNKALKLLQKGKQIANKFKDPFEQMKCAHNIAFIKLMNLTNLQNIDEIKNEFKNIAYFFQNNEAPHEAAYSINDYAVSLMLNGYYSQAQNYLRKARILANSSYSLYVIKCNLLIATCFPKEIKYSDTKEQISNSFKELINNNIVDDRILRKYFLNFAIIMLRYDDKKSAIFYLNSCRKYLKNSPSIARFNKLCINLNLPLCKNDFQLTDSTLLYYRDFPFEPWILSFGHD